VNRQEELLTGGKRKVGDSKAEGSLATGDGKQAAISLMSETDGTDCVSLLNSILFFFPLFMYFYFQMFFFLSSLNTKNISHSFFKIY